MDWYYANDGQRQGPISAEEFARLVAGGTVHDDTLVWRAGMNEWQPASRTPLAEKFPLNEVFPDLPPIVATPSARPGYGQGVPQDPQGPSPLPPNH